MVSVFKYFFPFIVLETSLSAIKFETRIYKPDTYLAIIERTWDIRVEIKFSIEKYQYYSQIGHGISIRSENIKPDQTVKPPKN